MPPERMCGSNLYGGVGVGQEVPGGDSSPGTIDKQLLGPWFHTARPSIYFFLFPLLDFWK